MSKVISEFTGKNVQLHMFNVMYNIKIGGLETNIEQIIFTWIQEVKRYIIYKKIFKRNKN